MKLWVSKNSEVPVREQLVAQIALAIAAGDIRIGEKLPSTTAIGRRYAIHSNTVGAAYRMLAEQGLIEFRHGSGFYVARSEETQREAARRLDALIEQVTDLAKEIALDREEILQRVRRAFSMSPALQLVVVEPDKSLREIIQHELKTSFPSVETKGLDRLLSGSISSECLAIAMLDEKPKIDPLLEPGQRCIYIMGRSAAAAMSGEQAPGAAETVAVVSGWADFLNFARIMLLAAKIPPGNLIVRSTSDEGWESMIDSASIIICDALTAVRLDGRPGVRVFYLISEESLAEVRAAIA